LDELYQVDWLPTRIVLAPPTPLPPPPTPTPIPPTPATEVTATPEEATSEEVTEEAAPQPAAVTDITIEIPAGSFTMGSDGADPEDAPAHQVDVAAYAIDRFEVTNADFDAFVQETGYVTYTERQGITNWRNEWDMGENNHDLGFRCAR
jgi:formylglycine-generating enzyme required for sulfatase activity